MRRLFYFILLVSLLFLGARIFKSQDINLKVEVNKDEIFEDEILKLEVNLTFEGWKEPKLQLPKLNDFEILGRIDNRKIERKEGKRKAVFKSIFFLLPKKTGTLTIGPFLAGGCKSLPIEIKVKPGKQSPQEEPPLPQEGISI